MKNLEEHEVRGLTLKQLITYIIIIISFIITLVIRDVKRENKVETMEQKIKALELKIEASAKEIEALKIMKNNQDQRLTKIETIIEMQKK